MKTFLLSAAIALSLSACAGNSAPPADAQSSAPRARGEAVESVPARSAPPALPAPQSLLRPDPVFPDHSAAAMTSSRAALQLRVDASTPESLVASLQAAERGLSAADLNRLRVALSVIQMVMSRKVAAVAIASPTNVNMSDQELLELAFGDIHNKTIEEVIAYGIRMAPVVVPDDANSLSPKTF